MTTSSSTNFSEHQLEQLRVLESKINALLPPRYQGCFEDISPKSMGSAKLKYTQDGKVAWDEIWTSFCHLALAGGPPHRGTLLEPVPVKEAESFPIDQQTVVAEIERAVRLTTGLSTVPSATPGWVAVRCDNEGMAAWLVRAIVAENVIARHEDNTLYLPAGPQFRLEKEIKNVVTSMAKTCHYLCDHMEPQNAPKNVAQKLIEPLSPETIAGAPEKLESATNELERALRQTTRLETIRGNSPGWLGITCLHEEMAVWMLRAVAVENVLVRREDDILYVPIRFESGWQQGTDRVISVVAQSHRLWHLHEAQS